MSTQSKWSARGYITAFTLSLRKGRGIKGQNLQLAIKTTSEAAEKSSQWLWRRKKLTGPPGARVMLDVHDRLDHHRRAFFSRGCAALIGETLCTALK